MRHFATRAERFLVLTVSVFSGVLLVLQAHINGQLGLQLGTSVQAALTSFSVGVASLSLFFLMSSQMRLGFVRLGTSLKSQNLRIWHLFGGVAGGAFVVAQAHSVPILGVTLFTIIVVSAEVVSALLIDWGGLGPGGVRKPTILKIGGAILAILAVVIASVDNFEFIQFSAFAILIVAAAKFGTTVQSAVNARISIAVGSALTASFISFVVGFAFLFVLCSYLVLVGKIELNLEPQVWFLYTGGLLGAIVVVIIAVIVPKIGVLIFGLCAIAGQVVGAFFLDVFAPAEGSQITFSMTMGLCVAILSVLVTVWLPSKARRLSSD